MGHCASYVYSVLRTLDILETIPKTILHKSVNRALQEEMEKSMHDLSAIIGKSEDHPSSRNRQGWPRIQRKRGFADQNFIIELYAHWMNSWQLGIAARNRLAAHSRHC